MSMFDLDYCRNGCGTPIGHQEDYCNDYPNCNPKNKYTKKETMNPPMQGHWE